MTEWWPPRPWPDELGEAWPNGDRPDDDRLISASQGWLVETLPTDGSLSLVSVRQWALLRVFLMPMKAISLRMLVHGHQGFHDMPAPNLAPRRFRLLRSSLVFRHITHIAAAAALWNLGSGPGTSQRRRPDCRG